MQAGRKGNRDWADRGDAGIGYLNVCGGKREVEKLILFFFFCRCLVWSSSRKYLVGYQYSLKGRRWRGQDEMFFCEGIPVRDGD